MGYCFWLLRTLNVYFVLMIKEGAKVLELMGISGSLGLSSKLPCFLILAMRGQHISGVIINST